MAERQPRHPSPVVRRFLASAAIPMLRYDAEIMADAIGDAAPDLRASILSDKRTIGESRVLAFTYVSVADAVRALKLLQASGDDEGIELFLGELFQGSVAQIEMVHPTLEAAQDAMYGALSGDERVRGRLVLETHLGIAALLLMVRQEEVVLPDTHEVEQLQQALARSGGLYTQAAGIDLARFEHAAAVLDQLPNRTAH